MPQRIGNRGQVSLAVVGVAGRVALGIDRREEIPPGAEGFAGLLLGIAERVGAVGVLHQEVVVVAARRRAETAVRIQRVPGRGVVAVHEGDALGVDDQLVHAAEGPPLPKGPPSRFTTSVTPV